MLKCKITGMIALVLVIASAAFAADWPQFRGVDRQGKSSEVGLLKRWPADGPDLLWSVDGLGEGWSSAAVSDGRIYITGKIDREGWVFAFNLKGKSIWKTAYGLEWNRSFKGARSTPTVDEGKLYFMSGNGVAYCYDASTGKEIWSSDVFGDYEGKYPTWGISECLLVDDGRVICTPGGKKASIVALNKITGKAVWACTELAEASSYGNPRAIQMGENRIIVQMLKDSVVGIDAKTGKLLWRDLLDEYHIDRKRVVNPNVPVFHDGHIYTTSGYDNGGAMLKLSADGTKAKRIWTDTVLDVHHGNVVLVDGYLYGANWTDNRHGNWACIRWADGKAMYDTTMNKNKGCIVYADGMLYCWDENDGELALVPATPDKFEPVSSFKVTLGKGMFWAHPAISDGVMYVRHGQYLMAYDIAAK